MLTVTVNVCVRYDRIPGDYIYDDVEVEILTVHFEKRTMRVRYEANIFGHSKSEIRTVNISAEPFFEKYRVVEAHDYSKNIELQKLMM